MSDATFDPYIQKLQQNVYGKNKGAIRLQLLQRDISEFIPTFSSQSLRILDVGCGAGQFAGSCLHSGHRVCLLDQSAEMLQLAKDQVGPYLTNGQATLREDDFLSARFEEDEQPDLLLMHGSAEWMSDTSAAIAKACSTLRPGGYLSLLIFNKDTHMFKKGVNGHLLGNDPNRKKKLFPPGAMNVRETLDLLNRQDGILLLQSGIRIFHGFFRQIDSAQVPLSEWIRQELAYSRQPPFSLLGQHSHFIWQKPLFQKG